jgi:hypothetical protein
MAQQSAVPHVPFESFFLPPISLLIVVRVVRSLCSSSPALRSTVSLDGSVLAVAKQRLSCMLSTPH